MLSVYRLFLSLGWKHLPRAACQRCRVLLGGHGVGPGTLGSPQPVSTVPSALLAQPEGRAKQMCSVCMLHSCTLSLSSAGLQVGYRLWKIKSVLVFSQSYPSRKGIYILGIGWRFQSLSYHWVMEITKVMLLAGINQFWLYFAGLGSNHISFNWREETNIELTQRISSVTTAIQIWRALHHWPGCRFQEDEGRKHNWSPLPTPEHHALQPDRLLSISVTFPPEIVTTSPSLPLLQEESKQARKENRSFQLAGCVLRWLLRVDGAKYKKWRSCGSKDDSFTRERETAEFLK